MMDNGWMDKRQMNGGWLDNGWMDGGWNLDNGWMVMDVDSKMHKKWME